MFRRGCGERMIGRDRHEFRAEQRVRAGRIDFKFARSRLALQRAKTRRIDDEPDHQPFRAADPVALHEAHLLRPAVERVEALEEILGIVGDPQEPLGELALFDRGARAPAAAIDHLLVGEHGVIDRVPVHLRLLARDEARLEKIEEQLLLVLVVPRIAGRDFARPVEREAHRLQLRPHRVDIGVGPFRRMGVVLHRGVFSRHAEGVPTHRMEDVAALRAAVARHHVAHRVVADMTHVDAPRRNRGTSRARNISAAGRHCGS